MLWNEELLFSNVCNLPKVVDKSESVPKPASCHIEVVSASEKSDRCSEASKKLNRRLPVMKKPFQVWETNLRNISIIAPMVEHCNHVLTEKRENGKWLVFLLTLFETVFAVFAYLAPQGVPAYRSEHKRSSWESEHRFGAYNWWLHIHLFLHWQWLLTPHAHSRNPWG